jgi:hypothetical protein
LRKGLLRIQQRTFTFPRICPEDPSPFPGLWPKVAPETPKSRRFPTITLETSQLPRYPFPKIPATGDPLDTHRIMHNWGQGPLKLHSSVCADPSPGFCPCSLQDKLGKICTGRPLTISSFSRAAALRRPRRPVACGLWPGPSPGPHPP